MEYTVHSKYDYEASSISYIRFKVTAKDKADNRETDRQTKNNMSQSLDSRPTQKIGLTDYALYDCV